VSHFLWPPHRTAQYNTPMQSISGHDLALIRPFFEASAAVASEATCHRAKCGTVIVKDGQIIGRGFNGPALDDEANRTCDTEFDLTLKPKYDKTCCIHAEWRAILDACKHHAAQVDGATLYFMRVDEQGNFTDAGQPYCTTCSRLALESGIGWFVLWNDDGADRYEAAEYNQRSYAFFRPRGTP
jgi:deoxycytidylate deaminase